MARLYKTKPPCRIKYIVMLLQTMKKNMKECVTSYDTKKNILSHNNHSHSICTAGILHPQWTVFLCFVLIFVRCQKGHGQTLSEATPL